MAEKLSLRDKLFKKIKPSCLNKDWEIYKEARNDVQRLIKCKKKKYFEEKLAENIAKPKNLWQALKSLGLPYKKTSSSNICLENKDGLLFDSFSIAETVKILLIASRKPCFKAAKATKQFWNGISE